MGLRKREYTDQETLITAKNLNDIQDAVIALEDGLFTLDNNKSGEVITITDAYKRGFRSLSIYGKTTQDGTPTPDNPVDLVSVGDSGSITVNVSGKNEEQSMTIATPNGLPGIPVSSGGNYTDANGQQWVCDEVDLARGVYVKKIQKETVSADSIVAVDSQFAATAGASVNVLLKKVNLVNTGIATIASDRAIGVALDYRTDYADMYRCYSAQAPGACVFRYSMGTGEKSIEDAQKDFGGAIIYYILATPIETPLSEEELAAYAALYTYRDNTTVSNDASAYMDLEYVMDSKKYIDSLVTGSGTIVTATVE